MPDFPDCNELITPYPIHEGEPITRLGPKPLSEFPDQHRFPHPAGDTSDRCGCLLTTWKSSWQGDQQIRLETIWQPLWDTRLVIRGISQLTFFDGKQQWPDVFELKEKGLQPWMTFPLGNPKKFHVWELEFTFSDEHIRDELLKGAWSSQSNATHHAWVEVRLGEKNHFVCPLAEFHRKGGKPLSVSAPFPLPLFIPSSQYFQVTVHWPYGHFSYQHSGIIRCVLHGYLSREIP